MTTVAAQEIKRRGIGAVDEMLTKGPVHIIRNNKPQYVLMTENAAIARMVSSEHDLEAGRVCRGSVAQLLAEIDRPDKAS